VRVDEVARVLDAGAPRLVYLVPTGHNPRGTVLPVPRRREIAGLAHGGDAWLVEDETHAWTVYGAAGPMPPIAAHGPQDRILTIGSLSKVLWGGLRVGWIRGPEPVVAKLGRIKAALDLGNDAVSQTVVLTLLRHLDDIAGRRRHQLAEGAATLCAELASVLPHWRVQPPSAGLSAWVGLPSGTGDAFAPVALRHGVRVLPGSAASPDETRLDHLRLAVSLPPDRLREAVTRLAEAWLDHTDDRRPVHGQAGEGR